MGGRDGVGGRLYRDGYMVSVMDESMMVVCDDAKMEKTMEEGRKGWRRAGCLDNRTHDGRTDGSVEPVRVRLSISISQ
jgi:hypothetical protein